MKIIDIAPTKRVRPSPIGAPTPKCTKYNDIRPASAIDRHLRDSRVRGAFSRVL